MVDFLHPLIPEALAWTLLHSLWQGLAIAALLWLVLALLGRRTNARYLAAVSAMALLLVMPVMTFTAQLDRLAPAVPQINMLQPATPTSFQPGADAEPSGTAAGPVGLESDAQLRLADSSHGFSSLVNRAAPLLVLVWLSGILLLAGRLVGGLLVVRRLRTRGLSLPADELSHLFSELGRRLAAGRRVALRLSGRIGAPMVIGVFRPLVLLPATMASGLPARDLELLLAHELAHVRRNDLLVSTLQRVAETVLYFHPATWWISGIILQEREVACDELAAAVTGAGRREFAATLVRMGEQQHAAVFAANATGGKLVRRVERLLGRDRPAQRLLPLTLAALLIAGAGLLLPGHAQAEQDAVGYRTVWATVHPDVQFGDTGIESIPAGAFVLLEERQGGRLVRRAVLSPPGTPAAAAGSLAGGDFTASADRPETTVWFEAGPGIDPVDPGWVDEVLERNVFHALRQDWDLSPTTRVVRTSSPELFESFVFAEYRRTADRPGFRETPDRQFMLGLQLRQHAHVLAHGLVTAESVLVSVFEALQLEDVSVALAQDAFLLVPWLPADEHRLELLEVLAAQLGSLPAELNGEFEAAIASFDSPDWRERARDVFEPDYDAALGATFLPLNFAFGTLNSSAGTEPGWYAEISPAGYVSRPALEFMISDPAESTLYSSFSAATDNSDELFGTAPELPAGHYGLRVWYDGRTLEAHIDVDTSRLLPLVQNAHLTTEGQLAWDPVPGADRYRVYLRTDTGVRLSGWLSDTELDIAAAFPALPPGAHEIASVWAVAGPEQCHGCELQASVTELNLPFTAPD